MKNQTMVVMAAMLVVVFATVPITLLTLTINVGVLALILSTLAVLADTATRAHSKRIVVKDTDGYPTKASK